MDITPFFAEYGLLLVFGVILGGIDAWVSAGFGIECI